MSSSSSRTQNQQQSSTSVQNLNVQDTEGVTLANSSGNTINVTDLGALDAGARLGESAINSAMDVGLEALQLGGLGVDAGVELAGRGLDNAQDATRGAFAFGETALMTGQGMARDALDANTGLARDAISDIAQFGGAALGEVGGFGRAALAEVADSSSGAVDAVLQSGAGVLDFARDIFGEALGAQERLTDTNLTGLGDLAMQTSQSADDRVTKVAMYAFVAVALMTILPKVFE